MSNFFLVRAGEGGHLAEDFAAKSLVAIRWPAAGDLSSVVELEEFRSLVGKAYPQMKKGAVINGAGILYKFRRVLQVSDRIVTYDPEKREYQSASTMKGGRLYH